MLGSVRSEVLLPGQACPCHWQNDVGVLGQGGFDTFISAYDNTTNEKFVVLKRNSRE